MLVVGVGHHVDSDKVFGYNRFRGTRLDHNGDDGNGFGRGRQRRSGVSRRRFHGVHQIETVGRGVEQVHRELFGEDQGNAAVAAAVLDDDAVHAENAVLGVEGIGTVEAVIDFILIVGENILVLLYEYHYMAPQAADAENRRLKH